jgi:ABC-2 type transport system permease protein
VIGFLFLLTLRQLVGKRSTLALLALASLPVILALIFRLSEPEIEPERWTVRVLYLGLVVTLVLSLTALVLGTSVMGDELEDGTATYLLTKPISRWQILTGKLMAAWTVTAALVVPSTGLSGLIALEGLGDRVIVGFSAAMAIATFAYSSAFVLLSLLTTRALIAGLVYAFIWEGAITEIFRGTRYLSIRHQALGIADWISEASPQNLDAYLRGETALVLIAIVSAGAFILAGRRLERIEVRE